MDPSDQIETRLSEIGAGAERARSELDRLIGQVEALRASLESFTAVTEREEIDVPLAGPPPPRAPHLPAAETPRPPGPAPDPSPPPPAPDPTPPAPAPDPAPPPAPESAPPAPTAGATNSGDNDQAARLVAMKLAVDGKGRGDIAAELDAKFGSADRGVLLDDVLARAGR